MLELSIQNSNSEEIFAIPMQLASKLIHPVRLAKSVSKETNYVQRKAEGTAQK